MSNIPYSQCVKAISEVSDLMVDLVGLVPEFFPKDEQTAEYERILERGKQLALAERSLESTKISVAELSSQAKGLENPSESQLDKLYESIYTSHTLGADYSKNEKYGRLVFAIQGLSENGVAADADLDDELITTQAMVNTIDPVTKMQMEDPVKGRMCGHSYERSSIVELVRRKDTHRGLRCPYVGCQERLRLQDLIEDIELREYLQRMAKKKI